MNTVSHSEAQALHAVADAVAADAAGAQAQAITVPEVAPYELHLIALSRLRPSARNVRKSGGTSIPALAASIARVGLLQNLTAIASPDGEHFEVVAGKRRLAALKLLAKRRRIGRDHPVPCLLVSRLKKAQIAAEAERLAAGSGWLPVMFRQPEAAAIEQAEPEAEADADGAELDEQQEAHATA